MEYWRRLVARADTYLKKSSLHRSCPFLIKHRSLRGTWHSVQCRHFACHVRSETLSIKRSKIISWQPPHFGIEAGGRWERRSIWLDPWSKIWRSDGEIFRFNRSSYCHPVNFSVELFNWFKFNWCYFLGRWRNSQISTKTMSTSDILSLKVRS